MKKFFHSLLAKYMLIIFVALSLIQASFIIIVTLFVQFSDIDSETEDAEWIEKQWHDEANALTNVTEEAIRAHFEKWKKEYPEAGMFWVDGEGRLAIELDAAQNLPETWTASVTAKFIKERYGGEPFTVIAFVGKDETNGFIVFELPRTEFLPPMQRAYAQYSYILLVIVLAIVLLFIFVSYLFFRGIRKRLVHLQQAMSARNGGLPQEIEVQKQDEIGQLEQTFNQMVRELRESKQREQEEEQLRKELIANLSHDLRTPLTKINAQTYALARENLPQKAREAVNALQASIEDIDRLIENLMSYTLLIASKYKLERQEVDVVRFVRETLATWYPVFEKEDFEMEVDLKPLKEARWNVDPLWLKRIFDNLLQNVLRHAKSGRYVGVKTESTQEYDAFLIIDKGEGMEASSKEKGAGIGLSIVDMMVKGMGIDWEISSSRRGTVVKIIKKYERQP